MLFLEILQWERLSLILSKNYIFQTTWSLLVHTLVIFYKWIPNNDKEENPIVRLIFRDRAKFRVGLGLGLG